jgi:hypothetical protein
LPFTLPATGIAQGFGMGDIRNKLNKIERAKADKAAMEAFVRASGWSPPPPRPRPDSYYYPKCACGLTAFETKVYQCGKDGYYCLVCMPWKWKRELMGHMTNMGLNYDAAEHGEEPQTAPAIESTMPTTRTFRIFRRSDGRFESRNETPGDSPLGVDSTLNLAVGSAHREATMTAKAEGCRVVIEVQQPDGKFKREMVVEPPRR